MKNGFTELRVGARTAPLGLRFWDPVTAAFVGDGLRVSAYPVADPTRRAAASVSPSRVWVFHKLPGMGAVERGEGDEAFWASPPPKRTIVVEVDDDFGRFVPFQLEVEVPVRRPLEWTPPAGVSFPGCRPGRCRFFRARRGRCLGVFVWSAPIYGIRMRRRRQKIQKIQKIQKARADRGRGRS